LLTRYESEKGLPIKLKLRKVSFEDGLNIGQVVKGRLVTCYEIEKGLPTKLKLRKVIFEDGLNIGQVVNGRLSRAF